MSLSIAISFVATQTHAVGMMYGNVCRKFPDIKMVYSEGGIGWVPAALERPTACTSATATGTARSTTRTCSLGDLPAQHVVLHDRRALRPGQPRHHRHRQDLLGVRLPHSSCIWPGTRRSWTTCSRACRGHFAKITYRERQRGFKWDCPEPDEFPRSGGAPAAVGRRGDPLRNHPSLTYPDTDPARSLVGRIVGWPASRVIPMACGHGGQAQR